MGFQSQIYIKKKAIFILGTIITANKTTLNLKIGGIAIIKQKQQQNKLMECVK